MPKASRLTEKMGRRSFGKVLTPRGRNQGFENLSRKTHAKGKLTCFTIGHFGLVSTIDDIGNSL
jgi:hypothetical protein